MNKVVLMGRCGADPEIKNGEIKVASVNLATSYYKTGGEEVTEWHRIKLFGKTAETAEKWIKKGARILVEGRISTTKYEEKYYTDIMVERLEIIDFPPKEAAEIVPAVEPVQAAGSIDFGDDIPF